MVAESSVEEIIRAGYRENATGSIDKALELFSQAADEIAQLKGDGCLESRYVLYMYGSMLLEVGRRDSNPVGEGAVENNAAVGDEGQGQSSSGEPQTEENKEKERITEVEKEAKDNECQRNGEGEEDNEKEENEAKSEDSEENDKDEDGDEEAEEEGQEGEAEGETFELGWDVLELAKKLYRTSLGLPNESENGEGSSSDSAKVQAPVDGSVIEDYDNERAELHWKTRLHLRLADVHYKLGELSLEGENWEGAIEDFNACLRLQRESLDADGSVHYQHLIVATMYQLGLVSLMRNELGEASSHYQAAIDTLHASILSLTELMTSLKPEEAEEKEKLRRQINDKKLLMRDLEERLVEVIDEIKQAPQNGEDSNPLVAEKIERNGVSEAKEGKEPQLIQPRRKVKETEGEKKEREGIKRSLEAEDTNGIQEVKRVKVSNI